MYVLLALAALGIFIWLITLLLHRRRALEHKK